MAKCREHFESNPRLGQSTSRLIWEMHLKDDFQRRSNPVHQAAVHLHLTRPGSDHQGKWYSAV